MIALFYPLSQLFYSILLTLLFILLLSPPPLDINECTLNMDNCNDNALCTDTMGNFTCVCTDGFRGDGVACIGELGGGVFVM